MSAETFTELADSVSAPDKETAALLKHFKTD